MSVKVWILLKLITSALRYLNAEKQQTWIDANRSIHKQLKGLATPMLSFRVKFYPSDPTKLKEEITRYQMYLQLKKDFFLGLLHCNDNDANLLAAYIVQSELGDYDADEHVANYISEVKCLPQQNDTRLQAVAAIHKTLAGQVPAEAEANFLKKAGELDTYGVDPHFVVDMKGNSLLLGITYRGVSTFYNNVCTQVYKWTQICRFDFDSKLFVIRLANSDGDDNSLLFKKFEVSNGGAASCFQRWILSQRIEVRFSGRCEQEVFTSRIDINRKEPSFTRSSSNAQFAQKYNSLRSATLPSQWRPHGSEGSSDRGVEVETSLNDSFRSSCGKDEVVSSVIVEEAVVSEVNDLTKTVVFADVMRENSPVLDGEESEGGCESQLSVSPEEVVPCAPDVFEWSNQTMAFPPMSYITQSEPNICVDDTLRADTGSAGNLSDTTELVEAVEEEKIAEMETPSEVAHAEVQQVEQTVELRPAVDKRRRCLRLRTVIRVLLGSIALLVVLVVLTFEMELDLPVLTDLRNMPEVQQLAVDYYYPLRNAVVDQYNELVGQ